MLIPADFRAAFESARQFDDYVGTGRPHEQSGWKTFHAGVRLTREQVSLIAGFTRAINVLVISGTWCGDCVQQCPILDHIARANPRINLRFIDRDTHLDFARHFSICGGNRVPCVIFLNEDFEFVSMHGDKTLARFRALAKKNLGAMCPLPGATVPPDEIAATVSDWLNEFERVALLLRLSAKLRERHKD